MPDPPNASAAAACRPFALRAALVVGLGLLAPAGAAVAGGGPENVLLVVNATSAASKEIANHYVRFRDLPATNVVYLNYDGDRESIDGQGFRDQILGPVLAAIAVRGLGVQIDTIAYSCDFPWKVRLRGDFPKEMKFHPAQNPVASLTGATFLWQFVLLKSPGVVGLDANWYAGAEGAANRNRCTALRAASTRAFRGRYGWRAGGVRTEKPREGRRYFLSTMLGVTSGRGNSVSEVVASLRRALVAEATPPTGAFYFLQNRDVRSKTREQCFEAAAEALRGLGAEAVVARGVLPPRGTDDIAGMMLGAANLGLSGSALTIQPGAICEHLTSNGGDLRADAAQTPLSELIRAGASGASGSVDEPLALQAKFPTPAMHVHYRRGASLAEAFFQSVAAPYQLLVVGDPLLQPWARRPAMQVAGWPTGKGSTVADAFVIAPRVTPTAGDAKPFWELFVDGRMAMRLPSGTPFRVQADQLGPGWHALSCVGVDPGPLEGQRRLTGAVFVPRDVAPADAGAAAGADSDAAASAARPPVAAPSAPRGPVRITTTALVAPLAGEVRVGVDAPGAERVEIRHNARVVATVDGPRGGAAIAGAELGRGPVRLQAVAQPDGARSTPLWVVVK